MSVLTAAFPSALLRRLGLIGLLCGGLMLSPLPLLADDDAPVQTPQQTTTPAPETAPEPDSGDDGDYEADTEHEAESQFLAVDTEDHEGDGEDGHDGEDKVEVDEWAASVIISVLGVLLLTFFLVQIRNRRKKQHEGYAACIKGFGWDCLRTRGFVWWIPAILIAFSFYSLAIEAITEREFHGMVFAFLPGTSVLLARYIGALLSKQEEDRLREEAEAAGSQTADTESPS